MPVEIFAQTQTGYADALTIGPSQLLKTINFSISAPYSVVAQIAKLGRNGIPYWDDSEVTIQPGQGSYDNVYGIRFRSFDLSNPSTVLAIGFYSDDPTPLGFIPGTGEFDTGGSVTPPSTTVAITGIVSATGSIIAGSGYTVAKTGTGIYVITFTTTFSNTPVIVATPISSQSSIPLISANNVSVTQAQINITDHSGNALNSQFNFLAYTVS